MLRLSVEGPGSELLVWSICQRASHKDGAGFFQRKHSVVFQKDGAFDCALLCSSKVFRCIINFCRGLRVHVRIFKESEFELESEDVTHSPVDFLFGNLAFLHKLCYV